MEDLPAEYIEHGLPLILVSGLTDTPQQSSQTSGRQESGTRITGDSGICVAEQGSLVKEGLADWDGTSQPWNAVALPGPTGLLKYRFRFAGRSYTLPPRKAAPQAQSPTTEQVPIRQNSELHSPLSPLSPGSPVHPDGIMTPLWFSKHQSQVPCLVITFFDFNLDGGPQQDEKIKADIISARGALTRSGFRTRFAAVLMSDRSIIQSPEMDDRFSSIRRATSLDAKTGLFFMPPMPSAGEVATVVQSLLTTLQPGCVEYYRELTKHARRKKARSSIPLSPALPVHTTAQSLSTPGWNARYELKQAVFAEARQEMDVAERHYTQALEDLCNTEGVFESMPSWSPRWDETRLLCDSMAARAIRCQLWNGMTTTAAQFWHEYRAQMKSLIDAKGKGTKTYGWLAWQARWARIMAQLIQLAELPMLDSLPRARNEPPLEVVDHLAYSQPDRSYAGVDGIPPTYHLHHPGYWHRLALGFARARYHSVIQMPEDDRRPPGQSPASTVVKVAQSYDTYLVPEPHEEYANAKSHGLVESMQITQLTEQANQEFANKGQQRMIVELSLELARDLVQSEHPEMAHEVLVPLWQTLPWRLEQWHGLHNEIVSQLLPCAMAVKDGSTVLALLWEGRIMPTTEPTIEEVIELMVSNDKARLEFRNGELLSPLQVSFAFDEVDAYANEPVKCQLVIRNTALDESHWVTVAAIDIAFSDGQKVLLKHDEQVQDHEISHIALSDNAASTSLFLDAAYTRIFDFDMVFHDSGPVDVLSISVKIHEKLYEIEQTVDDPLLMQSPLMYFKHGETTESYETRQEDTAHIQVLPKPPKIDITLHGVGKQHYAGEKLKLSIEVVNNEAHSVSGDLTVSASHSEDVPVKAAIHNTGNDSIADGSISELASEASYTLDLLIDSPQIATQLAMAATFTYKLDGGSQSILIKTYHTTIPIEALLEARWTFCPLLHPDPWPSYFDPAALLSEAPSGIPHRWRAAFSSPSPSTEQIVLHKTSMKLDRPLEDAVCDISVDSHDEGRDGKVVRAFELTTAKKVAEDRRPIQLLLACSVEWSRKSDPTIHTSVVPVPRITLPTSEPRVLCTVTEADGADATLTYHLENPSTHFLTFALTMDPSDDFAYSGVKYRTLSLAPMSRIDIPYQIMLHSRSKEGDWVWPNLQVVDSYYQKTLRVQPAGIDTKLDAERGIGIFIAGPSSHASDD